MPEPITTGLALGATTIVELAKLAIMYEMQKMALVGKNADEIKKIVEDVHAQFMALPSATTIPDV